MRHVRIGRHGIIDIVDITSVVGGGGNGCVSKAFIWECS